MTLIFSLLRKTWAIASLFLLAACSRNHSPSSAQVHARVHVDNGSSNSWQLVIDGKPSDTVIRPFFVALVEISPGKHTFLVLDNGKNVDSIEVEARREQVTVINPLALSTYELTEVTYSSGGPFGGEEPRHRTIKGERVVQADYDLLDPVTDSVTTQEKRTFVPDFSEKTAVRTKVGKRTEFSSAAEALAVLIGNPNVYSFRGGVHRERCFLYAIKILGEAPHDRVVYDALMKTVETPPEALSGQTLFQGTLVQAAFEALQKYESEIPKDRLEVWLGAKSEDQYDLSSLRARNAARILESR